MHSVSVGAAIAPDPNIIVNGFEVASCEAMAPEPVTPAARTVIGFLPGIFSSRSVKLLYIGNTV